MSSAIKLFQGRFGRVALLDMTAPLVEHAHHHCHVLLKAGGSDSAFLIRGERQPLTDSTAVLVNAWEPHAYQHDLPPGQDTLILALYIEPSWLAEIQQLDRQCMRALGTAERVLRRAQEVAQQRFHGISLCRAVFAPAPAAAPTDGFT